MERVKNIQNKLSEYKIDALMITSPFNLRYASNFTGTTGLSVITETKAYFITDFRYTQQAEDQAEGFEIIQNKGPIYDEVQKIIEEDNIERLGFEKNYITFATYQVINEKFSSAIIPTYGLIESLREVKDDEEISKIQKAVEITENAYEHILTYIEAGQTEIEIANELDFFMRKQGASGLSFDTIVASGVRSSMPHGVASDKKVEQGDMITIDFGCYYDGYVSDMTRTFALGDPGEKLKEIYQIVKEAQELVIQAAKPGMTGVELDKVARDFITEKGYGDAFGHTTGHGIGLEIHEGPNVSHKNEEEFVVGNVITDEPGIYIPDLGGVRIEDDLLITKDGNKNLMNSSKELIIL